MVALPAYGCTTPAAFLLNGFTVSAEPEKYFQRGEVVRLDGELDEHRFDTWQIAKEIHEYRRAGRWPRNPDACVRYGRTCPFFDVCTGAASLEDQTRFIRQEQHPELVEPASAVPQ